MITGPALLALSRRAGNEILFAVVAQGAWHCAPLCRQFARVIYISSCPFVRVICVGTCVKRVALLETKSLGKSLPPRRGELNFIPEPTLLIINLCGAEC